MSLLHVLCKGIKVICKVIPSFIPSLTPSLTRSLLFHALSCFDTPKVSEIGDDNLDQIGGSSAEFFMTLLYG